MVIDVDCVDPDYNDKTFVIDSTKSLALMVPGGAAIPYTEVSQLRSAWRIFHHASGRWPA